jgi:hypothetical protein
MLPRHSGIPAAVVLGLVCGAALGFARVPSEDDCAGLAPLCTRPPAEVVPWQRAHTAISPGPTVAVLAAVTLPGPTCSVPTAATGPVTNGVAVTHAVRDAGPAFTVATRLAAWVRSSANLPVLSERDRTWLLRRNEPELSAHAVELLVRLLEPVRPDGALAEFEWSLTESGLLGTPRDDATRLFCPRVQVGLDRHTGLPATLQIAGRDGQWIAVKLPEPMEPAATIALAGYQTEAESPDDAALPPSPAPQRLAADPTRPTTLR